MDIIKMRTQAIEKIYELDPKSEHLNYLLTRLVNNQEQAINNSFEVKTNVTIIIAQR